MTPLRHLPTTLRRGRLIGARRYQVCGVVRRGILGGQWDLGEVVRRAGEPDPLTSWRTTVEAEAIAAKEPDCVGGLDAFVERMG